MFFSVTVDLTHFSLFEKYGRFMAQIFMDGLSRIF